MNNVLRDQRMGRIYAARGLRVTRSCAAPTDEERMGGWARRCFARARHERNPATSLTLPPSQLLRRLESIRKRAGK